MSQTTQCPECAATVRIADGTVANEIIQCADCGVELEVLATAPWTLAPAPEEEEDWGE